MRLNPSPHFFVFYVTQIAVANDNEEAVQLLLEKGFVLITFSVSSYMYIVHKMLKMHYIVAT